MLRKTVTATHGEGNTDAVRAGAANDTADLARKTAAAYGAVDDLEAVQKAEDEAKAAKARANARSGIRTFSGCSC
jgi:hypothetical protein